MLAIKNVFKCRVTDIFRYGDFYEIKRTLKYINLYNYSII